MLKRLSVALVALLLALPLVLAEDAKPAQAAKPSQPKVIVFAVNPRNRVTEMEKNIDDFRIDFSRMPNAEDLKGKEEQAVNELLAGVQQIREQQTKLFDYLLTNHPTTFTMFDQSCEDRTGHWLYPIQPYNVGYNPKINSVRVEAFPDQYRAMDKMLGTILKHMYDNTTLFIISDHGIKPLRAFGDDHANHQHGLTPST